MTAGRTASRGRSVVHLESIDRPSEFHVAGGDPTGIVAGQLDRHPGVDVRELGVVVRCFSEVGDPHDQIDGRAEAVELEGATQTIAEVLPALELDVVGSQRCHGSVVPRRAPDGQPHWPTEPRCPSVANGYEPATIPGSHTRRATVRELPMFPLGTVLLPYMALPLHIFEPRYRALMHELQRPGRTDPPEFGVVLITRGHEVGGGDQRSAVGTVARLVQAEELADGRWLAIAVGGTRVRVERWLPDDPYPRAMVSDLKEDHDDAEVVRAVDRLTPKVRRILELQRELGDDAVPADYEASPELDVACWQPAVATPLAALDAQRLLGIDDCGHRLAVLEDLLDGVVDTLTFRARHDG